jgi:hypothetical protein
MNIPYQWLLGFYVINMIASALVQSLPAPTTASSKWYVFLYKFLSLLIADFKSLTASLPSPGITVGTKEPPKN